MAAHSWQPGRFASLPRLTAPQPSAPQLCKQGSLGAKLDALLASTGDGRKVNTTQVDNKSGFAWDASSGAHVAFISDGHYSVAVSGIVEGIEGDSADEGLSAAEVRLADLRPQLARWRSCVASTESRGWREAWS